MKEEKKISIIIPIYNVEKYLPEIRATLGDRKPEMH